MIYFKVHHNQFKYFYSTIIAPKDHIKVYKTTPSIIQNQKEHIKKRLMHYKNSNKSKRKS